MLTHGYNDLYACRLTALVLVLYFPLKIILVLFSGELILWSSTLFASILTGKNLKAQNGKEKQSTSTHT